VYIVPPPRTVASRERGEEKVHGGKQYGSLQVIFQLSFDFFLLAKMKRRFS